MNNSLLEEAFYAFLSSNQIAHLKYVLGKLGFKNKEITDNFLEGLYKHVHQKYQNKKQIILNRKGQKICIGYSEEDFALITYRIIKHELFFKKPRFLYDESVFKIISDYVITETNLSYISAADIASFVFCPISYCIKKSFNEDKPNEEAVIGTELHEENRLVGYVAGSKNKFEFTENVIESKFYTGQNKDFFDDIRSSKINYVGHNNTVKKYFKSSKGTFIGQPDYIFTNRNGENFIVEEKYRNIKKELRSLRDNHKAQLASYIIGLDEIKANYGYLVYWYYSYEDNKRYVEKCVVFRVDKSESDQQMIRQVYKNIINLNNGHKYSFSNHELDANKCANCVVRKFCGHKTGRLSKVSIPYNQEYYGLI